MNICVTIEQIIIGYFFFDLNVIFFTITILIIDSWSM